MKKVQIVQSTEEEMWTEGKNNNIEDKKCKLNQ